jgi:DNA-binding cell septation regulator SpoVG
VPLWIAVSFCGGDPMRVTKVDVKPAFNEDSALLAFIAITFDDELVLHDLRLVERKRGRPVLSMPSRKRAERCPRCSEKNAFSAYYCNRCGSKLPVRKFESPTERYIDVAFPIKQEFREYITREVLREYLKTLSPNVAQEHKNSWAQYL